MTIENGYYVSESVDEILDVMLDDAREYFDEDINDSDASVIRAFYAPIAVELAELQNDLGLVLEASQIDNADGRALALLTALIGISRRPAKYAKGEVTFSRSTASDTVDYTIPSGTKVQTDSIDPIAFRTTEADILPVGDTTVTIPVKATESGVDSNVGSNTVTEMTNPPTGIEDVNNSSEIVGGEDEEDDDTLRERAKKDLAESSRATQNALLRAISAINGVDSVSIFPNGDEYNLGSRPGFELVVQGGNEAEIGQTILDTKAGGDYTYSGNFGVPVSTSPELINGQIQPESFSRPTDVTIYIEATVDVDENYLEDSIVKNEIVDYIGGLTTGGVKNSGKLGVGDDVLYGEIEYAIRNVTGVYDVSDLQVSNTSPASGTSNISIDDFEVSETNATDTTITLNTNPV